MRMTHSFKYKNLYIMLKKFDKDLDKQSNLNEG